MKTLRTTLLTASFLLLAATATLLAQPTPTSHPTVNTIGNMGIGTMRPDSFKLEVAGGIGPSTNNTFSLGSSTRRWEDLFLGPNSLHIGVDGMEGIIGYDPITKSFLFDPDGDGVYEAIMDANGYIAVGTTSTLNPVTIEGDADQLVLQRKSTSTTRVSQKFNLLGDYWQIGTDNTNSAGQFFFDVNGTRRIVFNKNGNVGLGTVTPANMLDIEGGAAIGAAYSGNNTAPSNGLIVEGSVGIGTNDPSAFKLEVNGNVGPNANNTFDLGSQTRRWRDVFVGPNSLHLGISGNEATIGYDIVNNHLTFNPSGDGSAEAVMKDDGSTGLGTTTPQSKLDVEGGAAIGATYSGTTAAPTNGLLVEGSTGLGTTTPQNKLDIEGGAAIGAAYSGTNIAPANGLLVEGSTGLGTTTPQNKLDIEGGAAIGAAYSGTNTAPANGLLVEGSTGLGTTTPQNKLDIEGGAAIGAAYSGTNTAPANGLLVEGSTGLGTTTPQNKLDIEGGAAIGAAYSGTNTAPANGLLVEGSTGLGTTTPQSKLDIEGGAAIGATYSGTTAAPANGLIVEGSTGIGVTNPSSFKLEVNGDVGPSADNTHELGSNTRRWEKAWLGSNGLSMGNSTTQGIINYSTADQSLQFDPDGDGTPEIVMDPDGNFSVGTALTNNPLTIEGDPSQLVLQPKPTSSGAQRSANMTFNVPSANDWTVGVADANGILSFKNDGSTQQMGLDQSGNLTVSGNVLPTTTTQTLGSTSARWDDLFVGPNSVHIGNAASDETVLNYDSTSSTKRLRIDADGNGTNDATFTGAGRLGVGTDLPQNSLDVEGGAAIGATYSGTNAAPANGLLVEGNVGVGTTSTSDFKVQVAGNVGPNADYMYDLGSTTKRWRGLYLDSTGLSMGTGTNQGFISYSTSTNSFRFNPSGDGTPEAVMDINGNFSVGTTTTDNPATIVGDPDQLVLQPKAGAPNAQRIARLKLDGQTNDFQIGMPDTSGTLIFNGNSGLQKMSLDQSGNLSVAGNITPSASNRTLGTTSTRWEDLYVGPTSVHIGNASSDETVLSYANSSSTKRMQVDADGDGDNEATITGDGRVGIGTDLPQSSLDVEGGAAIGATYSGTTAAPTNGLLVEGNVGIGTTSTSDFKLQVEGTVGPNTDNTYSLGSASKRWTKVFTSSGLDINGPLTVAGSAGTAGQYLVSQGAATAPAWKNITDTAWGVAGNNITDDTTRYLGTNNAQDLAFATEGTIRARFLRTTGAPLDYEGAFVPEIDSNVSLGSPERRWKSLYVTGGSIHIGRFSAGGIANLKGGPSTQSSADGATISYDDANDVLVIDKPINSGGTTQPDLNNVFSLGTTTNRWKDLFLGPNTLHIGTSVSDEAKIGYNTASNELRIDLDNTGGPEFALTSTGDLTITGKATSAATIGADPATTLTTKGYVDGTVSAITLSGDVTGATGTTTIATTAGASIVTAINASSSTIDDARLATSISRDNESPAAGDVSGSLTAGYNVNSVQSGAGSSIVTAINASSSTIDDARLAASIARDSESPAAGDVSGSLSAGYSVNSVQSGAGSSIITAINASAGSIDAVRIGNGLTNTQVNDDLTISAGTIENTPIGATTAATGRFTTITGTTLPTGSTSTSIVTSNSGALETRTIASLTGVVGVSADSTLIGDGTTGSPLGVDLSETNNWTGEQIFPTTATQGDALIASINSGTTTIGDAQVAASISRDTESPAAGDVSGSLSAGYSVNSVQSVAGASVVTAINASSSTIDDARLAASIARDNESPAAGDVSGSLSAGYSVNSVQSGAATSIIAAINASAGSIDAARIGNGLTNTQVNDDLTISAGTIENTPIGATTAATGRFTTITGTTLPTGSTSTTIVTSNSGALETRTIASLTGVVGVSADSTLIGDGTTGSPLGVDLSETNTWTGEQTFPTTATQGDALIASINSGTTTIGDAQVAASISRDSESPAAGDVSGSLSAGYNVNSVQSGAATSIIAAINASAGSIDAARIGNGLTNTQVNDDLTISAGTIENTPIGATTAATGRFTTITGTTLPTGSTSTTIVTSNSGALETRTIASLTGVVGVSADSTVVGDGTTGSPLGVDLSETNTWTGEQTFPTTATQGDALIASINSGTTTIGDAQVAASISRDSESPAAGDVSGSLSAGYNVNSIQSGAGASVVTAINASSSTIDEARLATSIARDNESPAAGDVTGSLSAGYSVNSVQSGAATSIIAAINASAGSIDAARIGNGLTDTQVDNTLTLTAGTIDGVNIGSTTAAAGKFTTLTATSETVLSHNNSLVGDVNGVIPNGTSVAVITNGTANSDPTGITITLPSAVVGQVLWIYNADANATATLSPAPMAGSTTVAAGGRLMLIYVNNGATGWVAW